VKFSILVPVVLLASFAWANDAAAEVGVGGIQLRKEHRIAMVRERLFISMKKVRVEYAFLNESDENVNTEIAFPIPPYDPPGEYRTAYSKGFDADFASFKVFVEGKQIPYKTEVRALHDGKDVTKRLRQYGMDIRRYSGFEYYIEPNYYGWHFDKVPREKILKLQEEGLIQKGDQKHLARPNWQAALTYHWNQSFPAHKIVHIVHEYRPATGYSYFEIEDIANPTKESVNYQAGPGCPNEYFRGEFEKHPQYPIEAGMGVGVYTQWVRYILTTANTWKGPIRDFELIVEHDPESLVTFCWDGPVEKVDAKIFRARVKNFTPKNELTVYFFWLPKKR
jgi:hypothetical protein